MSLECKIEHLKKALYIMMEENNYHLLDKKVINLSKILDYLIYEYQRMQNSYKKAVS
jgi:hypothetical protein